VTFLQAMLLAVLQGASELFPISSLGHTVLVPAWFHWSLDRSDPTFLAFVVALHLGTAVALVVFYRREWVGIIRGLIASLARGRIGAERDERTAWLLIFGTIPVAILGVFFEGPVRSLFASTEIVAGFLVVNGLIMFLGERLRRMERATGSVPVRRLESLPWSGAGWVGLAQSLALFPGISRSGSSIVAGLLLGLTHEDAARYSFLLATPAIGAASILELPRLFAPGAQSVALEAALGGVLAGITAYASVAFLTRYFRSNDLRPFGWYCVIVGAISVVLAALKVIS
jgi:undecaprenyl-diphosphatase